MTFKEDFENYIKTVLNMGLPLSELKLVRYTKKEAEFQEPNYGFRILAVKKAGKWYFRVAPE